MAAKKDQFMRSDRNDEVHQEIVGGFLTRLIDEGPALVAAVVVTASSTVVGWGIYSDLADAFQASSREAFLIMLGLVCTIIGTACFGLGRNLGFARTREQGKTSASPSNRVEPLRRTPTNSGSDAALTGGSTNSGNVISTDEHTIQAKERRIRFLSDAAQELRAPLTSMCLAAKIIRKHHETTPEVVERFGETLVLEADKLGETIDEFLDLTRIESGCTEWNDSDLDPAELLHEAINQIEPLAIGYGVNVRFVLEPELSPIRADHDRIRQVLTVLLGVAVREAADDVEICIQIASADGGWIVTVGDSNQVYTHSESRSVSAVADPGDAENDRETDPIAHGIGLSVCRTIVSRYQGRVWLEGNLAESGCVRVTIPYPAEIESVHTATNDVQPTEQIARAQETSDPDLVSRHEAAVRALSERATHQTDNEQGPELSAYTDETVPSSKTTNDEFRDEDGPSADKTALAGAETPKAIPNRPDTRAANLPVTHEETSPAIQAQESPDAVATQKPQGLSKLARPETAKPDKLKARQPARPKHVVKSPQTSLAEIRELAATPSSPAVANATAPIAPQAAPESATNTPASSPEDRPEPHAPQNATAADPVKIATRPTLGRTVSESDENAPKTSAPVTGMAISARRKRGNRPMLALSGPSGATSGSNDVSVRAASDKALLELAFARDGGNEEVSREEAELVAKATGTTVAPYSKSARTARSVRSAATPANRQASSPEGGQSGSRGDTARDGEQSQGRLDNRVAKRLGID